MHRSPGDIVRFLIGALTLVAASRWSAPTAMGEEISFRVDVQAVLSKSGCNAGVCHGNQNGKGGFRLSLRGEDPAADFATLTRSQFGRLVNRVEPEQSLLLLKPTTALAHEGGRRFPPRSPPYEILKRWIAAGTPDDPQNGPRPVHLSVTPARIVAFDPVEEAPLKVEAQFSDGTTRDVTAWAIFEPANPNVTVSDVGLVRRIRRGETSISVRYLGTQATARIAFAKPRAGATPAPPDTAPSIAQTAGADEPIESRIDFWIDRRLLEVQSSPAPICDDRVYLRRVYLDLLGLRPSGDEARRFLADERPDKRARLIDELLDRPEFAECWALKWSDLLRNEEKSLDFKGVSAFHHWIRRAIAAKLPLDRFARELVTAQGSTYVQPAANYYRANRDAPSRAETTALVFFGTRLQCARCHNHPFDRWTRDDYYRFSAVFARVEYTIVENRRRDINDGHEFDGEQIVRQSRRGELLDPRGGAPLAPKLLGESEPLLQPPGEDFDRLEALGDWLASAKNPYFARAMVNRIWRNLLGRGLVEPVDDFRATNPPSHPELLDELASDLAARGFDSRRTIRGIMLSRAYQRSLAPADPDFDDEALFARAIPRRLAAEEYLDALAQTARVPLEFRGYPKGTRAGQLPGTGAVRPAGAERRGRPCPQTEFLRTFGKPPRLIPCDCERANEPTQRQAFEAIGGPVVTDLLTRSDNRLAAFSFPAASASQSEGAPKRPDDALDRLVNELYWETVSRSPSEKEWEGIHACFSRSSDPRQAAEDLLWALWNSREFLFRE